MVRKKYPVNNVVKDIIARTAMHSNHLPYELYKMVREALEDEGYYVGHINIKRVWRLYRELVNEGFFENTTASDEKLPSRIDKETATQRLG